jgi:excisionase family DNA binding protein
MPERKHDRITLADLDGRNFARPWEAAQILECDVRIVRDSCHRGEIPHTKAGNEYRIPTSWLRRQVEVTV